MAYSDPEIKADLAYWHRETPGSQAEIDYLVQCNDQVIPIEVKSGITGGLKSLVHYIQTKQTVAK